MRKKKRFDWHQLGVWIIAICALMGLIGIVIQLIRFGTILEVGGISRPPGF